MAEGLVNSQYSNMLHASSAGTKPGRVHPLAIRAMSEIGVDISSQRSKHLDEFEGKRFDFVIMVCSNAAEACPFFPGGREQIHRSFDDPASVEGSEEERLRAFRRVRDEINTWVKDTLVPRASQERDDHGYQEDQRLL